MGVPEISLSFEEAAATKEKESTGLGLGGWGTSWSFGGLGGAKKEEEKPKSPAGWVKSTFSDFNFGFGGGSGGEAKGASKKDDDDEDSLLPSWGTAGIGTAAKKEKKSSMFGGIDEEDEVKEDNWGGWNSKKEKETATKSWDTWGTSTETDKKISWGNFDAVEEEKTDPSSSVKEDEVAGGWGSFAGTSKSKLKKGKVTMDEPASKTAPKEDVWGWAAKDGKGKDGKGKTIDKKDDDDWGDLTSTAKDKNEEAASGGPPPLSILKGLPVLADGRIENLLGETVGELIEEDMAHAKKCFRMMYFCDEEGKVKNTKGKIIASAKTIGSTSEPEPEPVIEPEPELLVEAPEPEQAELPDISILNGLRVEADGQILDSDGTPVGELIEGDPKSINKKNFTCNTRGEIRDRKWSIVGQARVLPVAPTTIVEDPPGPEPMIEEAIIEETKEPELPDISSLEGFKLDPDGKVLNDDGVVIGELVDGDPGLIFRKKFVCTAQGTFVDRKLRVVGRCQILPASTPEPEPEPEPAPPAEPETTFETPDISILQGLSCEKDGKIMSLEGVVVGELIDGDAKTIAKKLTLCDAQGQFKNGKKILGKARVIPIEVIKALDPPTAEEVPEPEKVNETESAGLPPLSVLDNLNIEANGTILSLDKVVIGKVVEGDAKKFASMMYVCDAEGNVVTYVGTPVGKAVTVAAAGPAAPKDVPIEDIKDDTPENELEVPEESAEPPPLSILKGLFVEADGSVLDVDGNVIGQVIEGDSEHFQAMSFKCDGEGNVIGSRKKKVGKVKTVLPEAQPAADEPAIEDETPAAETAEETVPDLVDEMVSLEILKGRLIEPSGEIFDDDYNLIGRLIEGDAKKLNKGKAKCDAEGNVVDKKGKQVGKVEVIQPEKPEPPVIPDEPETVDEAVEEAAPEVVDEPVSVEILKGRTIEVTGEIFDADLKLIGRLVEGDVKKLHKTKAKCDSDGNVVDRKGKIVGKAEVIHPEKIEVSEGVDVPEAPENVEDVEEAKEEEIVAAVSGPPEPVSPEILKGRTIEASGDVLDDDMNIIGRLIDGNAKKLNKGQAKCDGDGNVIMKNKIAGRVEVIQPEIPENPEEPAQEVETAIETSEDVVETPAQLTLASLENLSLDEVGDVYTNDGVLVGRLVEGSGNAKRLYAKFAYCDAEGNVWTDDVKAKGRVEVVQPETPEEDMPPPDDSHEPEQPAPKPITLEDLEGRTVELNGDILNDDGQIIGKLVKGIPDKLFKVKAQCDDNGGVFHKNKKCGTVEVVQPESTPEVSNEEPVEEVIPPPPPAPEDMAEPEPPTFALVDGRKIEKNGDVLDDDNNVIAKLSKGSGSKLFKLGATCRADGTIWAKMKQVKDVALELILPEVPEEGTPETEAPAPPPPPPEPEIIEEEPEPKAEPPSFASLAGIKVDKFGEFLNADNVLVARLATGNVSKLYKAGATCDAEGKVWAKGKLDKTATVEMVFQDEPEAPEAPEAPEEPRKF